MEKTCNSEAESQVKSKTSELAKRFKKLFHLNHTVKDFVYNVQFKPNMEVTQQIMRRVQIHMQKAVGAEQKKLTAGIHLEKLTEIGEDTFVSPVAITKKSDGSVKIAFDSFKLSQQIVRETM